MKQPKHSSSVTEATDQAKQSPNPADLPARKRVVLTRPAERQQHLAQKLEQAGFEVLQLPALVISPVLPDEAIEVKGANKPGETSGAAEAGQASKPIPTAVADSADVSTSMRASANTSPGGSVNVNANVTVNADDNSNANATAHRAPEKSASNAGVANRQRGGSRSGLPGEQPVGQCGGVSGGSPEVGPQPEAGEQPQEQLNRQLQQQPTPQPRQQFQQQPEHFDALVFVSRAAWQCYWKYYLRGSGLGGAQQQGLQTNTQLPILACVGLSTAKEIARDLQLPLEHIAYPTGDLSSDSEGLWALLRPKLEELRAEYWGSGGYGPSGASEEATNTVKKYPNYEVGPKANEESSAGANESIEVLIVRGQTGRDWLADMLKDHGISVTCLSVYRRDPATWAEHQIKTLDRWAQSHLQVQAPIQGYAQVQVTGEEKSQNPISGSTGTWLITSAESLAAIAAEYDAHGLAGKVGYKPQAVVVVHERLVSPVQAWLGHWSVIRSPDRSGRASDDVPVVVTAPDDEAILAAILSM